MGDKIQTALSDLLEPVLRQVVRQEVRAAVAEAEKARDEKPKMIDIRELARLSGYKIGSLYSFSCKGQIPGCKRLGRGKLMFDRTIAERWVAEGCPKEDPVKNAI